MKKLLLGMLAVLLALGMLVGCNSEEAQISGEEIHPSIQGDWVEATWGFNEGDTAATAIPRFTPGAVTDTARYMFGPRNLVTFSPGNSTPASSSAGLVNWRELATNYDDAGYTAGVAAGIDIRAPRDWILAKSERVQRIILSGDSHFMNQMYQPQPVISNAAKIAKILEADSSGVPAVRTWTAFPDLVMAQHVIDGSITIFDYASNTEIGVIHFLLAEMNSLNRDDDIMHIYAVEVLEGFTGNYPTVKGAYVRPNIADPNDVFTFVDEGFVFDETKFVVSSLTATPSILANALSVGDTDVTFRDIDITKVTMRNLSASATASSTLTLREVIWTDTPGEFSLIVAGTAVAAGNEILVSVEGHYNGIFYFPPTNQVVVVQAAP